MAETTLEQIKTLRAKTPAQKAALLEAGYAMDERYAGHFVAYTDDWNGDELVRTVVAAAVDPSEFQRLMAALEPRARRVAQLTLIPPADAVSAGSASAP